MKREKTADRTGNPAEKTQKKGLSLTEMLRLKKLKKSLSGGLPKIGNSISTQDTITFDKMFRDGICRVEKNRYTKMIEFEDINYVLLDDDERKQVLELYSDFINYFDPNISVQVFLFNRHVNPETLSEQFMIESQDDEFNDIREEYSQMLTNLSATGNNGVIKDKYFIIGIEATDINDARRKFAGIEKDIINNLDRLGSRARVLNGDERMKILYEYFNQDRMDSFKFSFREMVKSGKNIKDYIAPQGFEFRFPGRYKAGHMFGCTKYLDVISPQISENMIRDILDIDSNLVVSIHMKTLEAIEAIKLIKHSLTEIQKEKINEQKKAVRSGYDMDIRATCF